MHIEIAFDPKLFLPVLLSFIYGVLPDHDHLGDVPDSFIRPDPCDSLEAATDLSEYPLQQRYRLRGNDPCLELELDVGKETISEVLKIGCTTGIAFFLEGSYEPRDL